MWQSTTCLVFVNPYWKHNTMRVHIQSCYYTHTLLFFFFPLKSPCGACWKVGGKCLNTWGRLWLIDWLYESVRLLQIKVTVSVDYFMFSHWFSNIFNYILWWPDPNKLNVGQGSKHTIAIFPPCKLKWKLKFVFMVF